MTKKLTVIVRLDESATKEFEAIQRLIALKGKGEVLRYLIHYVFLNMPKGEESVNLPGD